MQTALEITVTPGGTSTAWVFTAEVSVKPQFYSLLDLSRSFSIHFSRDLNCSLSYVEMAYKHMLHSQVDAVVLQPYATLQLFGTTKKCRSCGGDCGGSRHLKLLTVLTSVTFFFQSHPKFIALFFFLSSADVTVRITLNKKAPTGWHQFCT